MPTQAAPNSVMDSAMRLMELRHSERVRKKSAEMKVPPLAMAMAIHQT
jgi:hypothetical protein